MGVWSGSKKDMMAYRHLLNSISSTVRYTWLSIKISRVIISFSKRVGGSSWFRRAKSALSKCTRNLVSRGSSQFRKFKCRQLSNSTSPGVRIKSLLTKTRAFRVSSRSRSSMDSKWTKMTQDLFKLYSRILTKSNTRFKEANRILIWWFLQIFPESSSSCVFLTISRGFWTLYS